VTPLNNNLNKEEFMHLIKDANGLWKLDKEDQRGYVASSDGGFPQPENKDYFPIQSTIFGATCDSLDFIIEKTPIPELEVGDYFCFRNMGAYTYSASSEFNGIPNALVYCEEL